MLGNTVSDADWRTPSAHCPRYTEWVTPIVHEWATNSPSSTSSVPLWTHPASNTSSIPLWTRSPSYSSSIPLWTTNTSSIPLWTHSTSYPSSTPLWSHSPTNTSSIPLWSHSPTNTSSIPLWIHSLTNTSSTSLWTHSPSSTTVNIDYDKITNSLPLTPSTSAINCPLTTSTVMDCSKIAGWNHTEDFMKILATEPWPVASSEPLRVSTSDGLRMLPLNVCRMGLIFILASMLV